MTWMEGIVGQSEWIFGVGERVDGGRFVGTRVAVGVKGEEH